MTYLTKTTVNALKKVRNLLVIIILITAVFAGLLGFAVAATVI